MLTIKECRRLLDIQSRDTMNDYLKSLELTGRDHLSWSDIKLILELQTYLGLKPGINSKEGFKQLTPQERSQMFINHSVDINAKLEKLKQQTHRVSVQLVLNRE
ncbi:hypothetical protein LC593_35920 [Nostoc sp. CHAB 5844]|nr:hypothetical protein [Nostoc sp. CHAB 5844]